MEATALTHSSMPGLSRPSPLLRLQSDEKLVALTRRGQHAAFETLFSRYQSRLLSFCRHMLSSKEDAEDVLQEVFTAAFNAILADEREINVRPWLYRIARNRSLNHLRRASAVGVDSMDIHFAEGGIDTGEKVMRRESFRQLIADVQQLPETQRTALLLREIDALSYEQIADAMETTVPSVKSLLVRARISLAEAAEARKLSCEEVRLELGEAAEGLAKLGAPARRHVRDCERCHDFKKHLKANNHALAAIFPIGPLFMLKKLVLTKLGSTASAGSAHVAGGAGATAGAAGATAAAGAASAGGAGAASGILTAGAGALATKAVAGLAAAALVTAGAVAAEHSGRATHRHHTVATASASARRSRRGAGRRPRPGPAAHRRRCRDPGRRYRSPQAQLLRRQAPQGALDFRHDDRLHHAHRVRPRDDCPAGQVHAAGQTARGGAGHAGHDRDHRTSDRRDRTAPAEHPRGAREHAGRRRRSHPASCPRGERRTGRDHHAGRRRRRILDSCSADDAPGQPGRTDRRHPRAERRHRALAAAVRLS